MAGMDSVRKWSPIRIPDALAEYSNQTEDGGDPTDVWDASDWKDPDAENWKQRLMPSHMGQWLILGAGVFFTMGVILWLGQFFPLTHANPYTLIGFTWPASLLIAYVVGREAGIDSISSIDWAFLILGKSVKVIPGKFVDRFGNKDAQHVTFTPIKNRSYGGFSFSTLKLGDLPGDRDRLMSKAKESNRGPDSDARMLLPGPLTGENNATVLGRVFGVHGGSEDYHDSGQETDIRITSPTTLDDEVAADVLNQLELYDKRIIPELQSVIDTLETQKQRYKHRAEAERDPELDRILGTVETLTNLLNRRHSTRASEDTDEADEIAEQARQRVNGE